MIDPFHNVPFQGTLCNSINIDTLSPSFTKYITKALDPGIHDYTVKQRY